MNKQDKEEFVAYLRACTDSQVYGVLEKESVAGRVDYVDLAKAEPIPT
jgi:hypothetical protein